MPRADLDLLIGPTACGKSAVALALAKKSGGEILSVDSMKLYKGLNIGVAKPSDSERAAVPHHLIDWKQPHESCSVAEWLEAAEGIIADAKKRGLRLIGEGGTALYIKALREGLFEGPGRDDALRARLESEANASGLPALYARLQKIDPAAAAKILPGDRRRIVRALEVHELTGKPISEQQAQWGTLRTDLRIRVVGLAMNRAKLYERIDKRVGAMFADGWLDECRALLALDETRPLSKEARQAIGYRTLFAHLRGECTLEDACERIQFDTHHFARRQLSWYRRFPAVSWVDVQGGEDPAAVADRVEAAFERDEHTQP